MKSHALVALAFATAPALAAPPQAIEPMPGANAILSSDYSAAESQLRASSTTRFDAGRDINLGIVLANKGQIADAQRLFTSVLNHDEEYLTVASGEEMSSHAIARTALKRLESGSLAK